MARAAERKLTRKSRIKKRKNRKMTTRKWWTILEDCKHVFKDGDITRVFLYGPPGTGKSSWPVLYMKSERVAITKGTTSDHLLGIFTLQDGETVWVDGPASRAMRHGKALVLDEIVEYSEDVEAILHAICDDPSICQVQLTNGEILKPKSGFMVFATTNGRPDQLGEALRDRFEMCLWCNEPHPAALQKLPEELRPIVVHQYTKIPKIEITVDKYTLRQCMAFPKIAKALDSEEIAARILFGSMGSEFLSVLASCKART